jgi:hypothetical protein
LKADDFLSLFKHEDTLLGRANAATWFVTFDIASYPGPEQCSLARVFVNEFLDSCQLISFVNNYRENMEMKFGSFHIKGFKCDGYNSEGLHEQHLVAAWNL